MREGWEIFRANSLRVPSRRKFWQAQRDATVHAVAAGALEQVQYST